MSEFIFKDNVIINPDGTSHKLPDFTIPLSGENDPGGYVIGCSFQDCTFDFDGLGIKQLPNDL